MTDHPMPEKQAWRALAALCIGFFMILVDESVVSVAIPTLRAEFDAGLGAVMWVSSIYLLLFAVPLLLTGRMGDRFGQRNIYMVGMVVFTLSSLACGLSTTAGQLIVARACQGLGAAIVAPQSMAVINRVFRPQRRGTALGVWGAVAGFAMLTGPIIGGLLITTVGWSWIFFINVPLGVLALLLAWRWVPDLPRTAKRLDLVSVLVSLMAMTALVFAIQQGPHFGWPWWVWLLLGVAALGLGLFVHLQRRTDQPLMPLSLFGYRNFALGSFSVSMMSFTVAGTLIPMMLFLQEGHGLSADKAGLMLAPMAAISGVMAPFVGRLADRINPRLLSMMGFSFMAVACCSLLMCMVAGLGLWWTLVPIVVLGLGNATVWSPNSATAMRQLPLTTMGAAAGVYSTTRQVGSVVGVSCVSAVMQVSMNYAALLPAIASVCGLIAVSQFVSPTFSPRA